MKESAPLICLITPGHLSSTPRLIKEADALVEAGFRVHVVSGRHYPPVDPLDEGVLAKAQWASTRVDARGGISVVVRKSLRRIARVLVLVPPFATVRMAARAQHAETLHLAAIAAKIPADLYLGHCLAGLPAATLAAKQRGVRCGFDAEDFHDAESSAPDRSEIVAAHLLQRNLLGRCTHLTAASPLIGQNFATSYDVKPYIVLNVFPRSQAPADPVNTGAITPERPARFYWFSQTIGPGRGLEKILTAMGQMKTPVELHLRGFAGADYQNHLASLAAKAGVKRPIQFLPPGPAEEMARLAASSDLGLSTEESTPLNRDLCLTNKLFVYLLAGIPQLLSCTSAQRALAPDLGNAALLAQLDQPQATATQLDEFFADPTRVQAARHAAWKLGHEKYCWDVEKLKFIAGVTQALAQP